MEGTSRASGAVVAGRYVLEKQLGVGAFGEVWSARDEKAFQRRVAIKFLLEQHAHNPEAVARFWREGEATAALSHPNVVSLLEFGDDGGGPYLVSEFVDGVSLRAILERSLEGAPPPALPEVLEIFRQICAGVSAAHASNIVHRDLKPENVMVQRERATGRAHVTVLDFGIARMLNADAQSKVKARTGAGQVLGSPQYMSPEQLMGDVKSVDERSDVFALGALLFEMLTLRPAFEGTQFYEVVTAILEAPRPVVSALRPDVPPALDDVLARALAVKREERFASVDTLREAVDAAFASASAPVDARAAGEAGPAPRRQSTARMRRSSDVLPADHEEWRFDAGAADRSAGAPVGVAGAPAPRGSSAGAARDGGASAAMIAAMVTVLLAAAAGAWFTPARARLIALFRAHPAGPASVAADAGAAREEPAAAPVLPARWIAVPAPAQPFRLGRLTHHEARAGFTPGAGDVFTGPSFEIQDREVTVGEYESFARAHPERAVPWPPWVPAGERARAALPAVGTGLANARAYCASLGGDVPTEAQWEYAARGATRRLNPWGDGAPPGDVAAYRGPGATLAPPGACSADRTPEGVMDLAGSVPEWTSSPWRADDVAPGAAGASEEAFVVRGLPLREARPREIPPAALLRQEGCGAARCSAAARALAESAGFRCVRPVRAGNAPST